jgi:hypothetical protein
MKRREFFTRVADASLKTSVVVATSALTVGSDVMSETKDKVSDKLKELEDRFDKLEHHHKNLIRVGGFAFALSTGIDVVSFL